MATTHTCDRCHSTMELPTAYTLSSNRTGETNTRDLCGKCAIYVRAVMIEKLICEA